MVVEHDCLETSRGIVRLAKILNSDSRVYQGDCELDWADVRVGI